jgi:chromosome segregation ATPase
MDGIDGYGDQLKPWDYKASKDGEVVPAEFARRIERERDSARKDAFFAEELHRRRFGSLKAEFEQVMREREEAREELARVRKELVSANRGAETNSKVSKGLCAKLIEAERERDEARRERDEALEQKNSAFNSIRSAWSLLDNALKEEA